MKDPYANLYEVTEIHDLRDVIKKRVNEFPENPVFLVKEKKGGEYVPISTEKYDHDIDSLGTYFMSTVKKGARIAIFAETRYEWYTTYLATTNGTGCIVPLDKELPVDDVLNMLTRAEVEILVFSKSKLDIVKQVYGKVDTIKYWICTEQLDDERFLYYQDCLKAGEEKLAAGDKTFTEATIDPEDMTILLFTSGTTAKSKAVMLCQKNICKNLMSMFSMLYIDRNDVWLSVLPLHHTYECTCGFLGQVYRGTTVGICEGLRYIAQNLQEVRPTCILMVPVMLELFYKKIQKGLKEDPAKAKKLQTGMTKKRRSMSTTRRQLSSCPPSSSSITAEQAWVAKAEVLPRPTRSQPWVLMLSAKRLQASWSLKLQATCGPSRLLHSRSCRTSKAHWCCPNAWRR